VSAEEVPFEDVFDDDGTVHPRDPSIGRKHIGDLGQSIKNIREKDRSPVRGQKR